MQGVSRTTTQAQGGDGRWTERADGCWCQLVKLVGLISLVAFVIFVIVQAGVTGRGHAASHETNKEMEGWSGGGRADGTFPGS